MSDSKNEQKKYLDSKANDLYNRLVRITKPEKIKGCSELEIAQLEQIYHDLSLPYSYKAFLRLFGHGLGIGTDFKYRYKDVLLSTQYQRDLDRELREEGETNPEEFLAENAFVFAEMYKMEIWYFIAEEGVEDPVIFYDTGSNDARKIQESIFDFWSTEVESAEKEFEEREQRRKEKEQKENS